MPDEKKQQPTSQPSSSILTGTERPKTISVLPNVDIPEGAEGLISVEQQPEDQIAVETPSLTTEKIVEISQVSPTLSQSQPPKAETKPEEPKNDKIITIEKARAIVNAKKKSIIPPVSASDDEFLAGLEVKADYRDDWEKKRRVA